MKFSIPLLFLGFFAQFAVAQTSPAKSAPATKTITPAAVDSLQVEYVRTQPDAELWLQPGDRLQVRVKARTGLKVSLWNKHPLPELPAAQNKGETGLYAGTYIVQPGDKLSNLNVPVLVDDTTDVYPYNVFSTSSKVTLLNPAQPLYGVTQSKNAYMNYGLGEDRLGGAKMGFLDSLVRVQVNGKVGRDYRIRLSNTLNAYIPEQQVKLEGPGTYTGESLTSSWSVTGDSAQGKYDYVRVAVGQRLPYTSYMDVDPARIIVDIYGAVSNTNWMTLHRTLREVKNVQYQQIASDVYRVIIDLKHPQAWGYSVGYKGTSLVVKVKRQPPKLKLKHLTIAVDAGHGGTNKGATGKTGIPEKDITLKIAQQLQQELTGKKATVIMTREADVTVDNTTRLQKLREAQPDLLVSVHVNSSGRPEVRGTSTYYRHLAFRPLSQALYEDVLQLGLKEFGNIGGFNFALNAPTEFPNALVETAFGSNPEDEQLLINAQFQENMAKQIRKGVQRFLKETRKRK
ncbi:N-acetylmuramoyl-L-alanine amidase [Rufibacter sediminis]|uniref:N-acetylmuramoyl-L-alanine amidase n=1 Tax=Rufibacter sediminis TaxID=2762756 RepID=A0ABR6VWZ5_9BACT|nr:N-acetylmuramoyl-L-alanine amidase [Rufibacter sediminis]MBC3541744.1 N-acetylmuramoyl-L-alanine amidase [Rufibacter sediminis]